MMERLKLQTLGLELEFVAVSAFGNLCFHFLLWTRPTSVHKTMNSTAMCLSLEQTGKTDNNMCSNKVC